MSAGMSAAMNAASQGASARQVKLIEKLQDLGAAIPCKGDGDGPDFGMLASVAAADAYIKQWLHLLQAAGGYRPGAAISVKQEQLIGRLAGLGATLPEDGRGVPSLSAFTSVGQADAFIRQWEHLLWSDQSSCSAADWGGIPNH